MLTETYFVYIMTSRREGPLYVGVTGDLGKRVWEHREDVLPGFTQRWGLKRLVYFEMFEDIHEAIAYEKRLKRWRRQWKVELIEKANPEWRDLFDEIALG